MTKQQKRKLIEVIKHDCKLGGEYKKGDRTCVIGAMLLAATQPRSPLRKFMEENNSKGILASELKPMRHAIAAEFGIDARQMEILQRDNDSVADGIDRAGKRTADKERRAKVLERVQSWTAK